MIILILLMILSAAILFALDVSSSKANNAYPQIFESNRFFRKPDGRSDISKLIIWKVILFGVCLAAACLLYFKTDAGVLAFLVFPLMAAATLPIVLKNYRLNRQYRNK